MTVLPDTCDFCGDKARYYAFQLVAVYCGNEACKKQALDIEHNFVTEMDKETERGYSDDSNQR